MGFIRPTLKTRQHVQEVFQTYVSRETIRSQWVSTNRQIIVPSGTMGRVGEICDAMNKGSDNVTRPHTQWLPPNQYEWYAKKMGLGPEFIKRCEDWHAANPTKVYKNTHTQVIDPEPVLKMMKKYSKKGPPTENGNSTPTRPPIDRLMVAWECAGYSAAQIEMAVARLEFMESQMEVNQKALDAIFGNYSSASKPVKTKTKKLIKAVKKKMT